MVQAQKNISKILIRKNGTGQNFQNMRKFFIASFHNNIIRNFGKS